MTKSKRQDRRSSAKRRDVHRSVEASKLEQAIRDYGGDRLLSDAKWMRLFDWLEEELPRHVFRGEITFKLVTQPEPETREIYDFFDTGIEANRQPIAYKEIAWIECPVGQPDDFCDRLRTCGVFEMESGEDTVRIYGIR